MNTKSVFQSKTVWVQAATVLSLLVPQVQVFLTANPVPIVAALGAVNVLVRFVTKDKVSIFGAQEDPEEKSGGGLGGPLLVVLGAAGLLGAAPPSCAPKASIPFQGTAVVQPLNAQPAR